MIEVTDADVAEALRLGGYAYPDKQGSIDWVRDKAETCHTPELLFAHAQTIAKLRVAVETLKVADDAINEMFRYFDGGETRGSYDGKPERNQLRKAGYKTRAAFTQIKDTGQ